MYVYVCIYIYIYIYMYTHTYIARAASMPMAGATRSIARIATRIMLAGSRSNNKPPLNKTNKTFGQQSKPYYQFRRRLDFPHS